MKPSVASGSMVKWVAVIVALLVLAGGLFSLKTVMSSTPPGLRVTAGKKVITVVLGSYCWKSLWAKNCAEAASPPDLVKTQPPMLVELPEQQTLEFVFDAAPEDLKVSWWVHGVKQTENLGKQRSNTLGFAAMSVPGVYPVCLETTWERGNATYCFKIETRATE